MFAISVLVSIAVFGMFFWYGYLLLVNPKAWVEWMLVRPWRSWGLAISIIDEQKLRKKARWFGIFMVASGLIVGMILFFGDRVRF